MGTEVRIGLRVIHVCNDENKIIKRIRITSYSHKGDNDGSIDLLCICGGVKVLLQQARQHSCSVEQTQQDSVLVGLCSKLQSPFKYTELYITIQKYMYCYSLQE